ncbi:AAA family ATPase [Pseudodesulfovibrio sp.]|uniref:AAA family ATPase n=1 Tax=unclassified Pseudodesulfovibrio TaxID=2661612 RepID=UPI003B00ED05
MVDHPVLYIFSGLPGSGKTALAKRLSAHVGACYLRIDTIEQGLRDLCSCRVEGEGYRLAYRIAADNLTNGISVVADSCNPIPLTRVEWNEIAYNAKAGRVNIEIRCSDTDEHRARIESRPSDIPGLKKPTWEDVCRREYVAWSQGEALRIDTAGQTEEDSFAELLAALGHAAR